MAESTPIEAILARYFGDNQPERLVGAERKYCSGYNNIVRFVGNDGSDPSGVKLIHAANQFEFDDPIIAPYTAMYGR